MVDHGQPQNHMEIPQVYLEARMYSINQKVTAGMELSDIAG